MEKIGRIARESKMATAAKIDIHRIVVGKALRLFYSRMYLSFVYNSNTCTSWTQPKASLICVQYIVKSVAFRHRSLMLMISG